MGGFDFVRGAWWVGSCDSGGVRSLLGRGVPRLMLRRVPPCDMGCDGVILYVIR